MLYYTNFLFLYACLLLVQSGDSDDRYKNQNNLNALWKFSTEPRQLYSTTRVDLPYFRSFRMIHVAVTASKCHGSGMLSFALNRHPEINPKEIPKIKNSF